MDKCYCICNWKSIIWIEHLIYINFTYQEVEGLGSI